MKYCSHCKTTKSVDAFHKNRAQPDGRANWCATCFNKYSMDSGRSTVFYHKYKHITNPRRNARTARLRQEVLVGYGPICNCCGEREDRFLTVDHVNNDGEARRKISYSQETGASLYVKLIKNRFPKDYQILCWNCNLGKRFNHGRCPHSRDS